MLFRSFLHAALNAALNCCSECIPNRTLNSRRILRAMLGRARSGCVQSSEPGIFMTCFASRKFPGCVSRINRVFPGKCTPIATYAASGQSVGKNSRVFKAAPADLLLARISFESGSRASEVKAHEECGLKRKTNVASNRDGGLDSGIRKANMGAPEQHKWPNRKIGRAHV